MTIDIIIFLSILLGGFILLVTELFALEVSALAVLLCLTFTGLVDTKEALGSFGNQSIFLIGSLFILIAGLRKTGVVSRLEDIMSILGQKSRTLSFIFTLVVVAVISAFISNTATLAVCIPLVVVLSKGYGETSRAWLMPIAFASVLGGMNSLIGTSTNIIISSLLPEYGLEEFNLFTTAYVGLPILIIGLVYLSCCSKSILLRNGEKEDQSVQVKYDIRSYTAEIVVGERSTLAGKTLSATPFFKEADVTVLNIIRKDSPKLYPHAGFLVRAEDQLLVEGNIGKLTEITDKYGLKFSEETKQRQSPERKKSNIEVEFHEVLVAADSLLVGRRPSGVSLRHRFDMSLIAINRKGVTLRNKLSQLQLEPGDILVVQFLSPIGNETLEYLGLVPLKKLAQERLMSEKAWLASAIFILAIVAGSLSKFPLTATCMAGAVLLPMFGILKMNEFYSALEWRILIFIGAVLSLGKGMVNSGSAAYLSQILGSVLINMDPTISLAFFFILTIVLTSLLSNQATAVVMIPLAINTASSLGLDPMPFVMAVTTAASCCFITPFEPAFMLVYGPGGYSFSDFFKLGIILNILALIIAITVIPLYWSF